MKKYQKISLIFILSVVIIIFALPAYGAGEALEKLQKGVISAFKWGLSIAGLLAVISFMFGAIQYMLSKVAEGKERMIGSVLGLLLIFVSWMVLQTVNPKLTELSFNALPTGTGIFYVKDDDTKAPANMSEIDTSALIKLGYKKILYSCIYPDIAPRLFAWSYDSTGLEGPVGMYKMKCNQTIALTDFKSFEMDFERPGIYFCTGTSCENSVCSKVYTESVKNITGDQIKSVMIINDWKDHGPGNSSGMMGVVLHASSDFEGGGDCDGPTTNDSVQDTKYTEKCEPVRAGFTVRSADIFYLAKDKKAAGSGIGFYSKSTGWNEAEEAGTFLLTPEKIAGSNKIGGLQLDPKNDMKFEYKRPDSTDAYQKSCKNFKECYDLKSMQTNDGNYLVMIGSQSKTKKEYWCQTFTKKVPSFAQTQIIPTGATLFELLRVWVITTAK